MRSVIIISLLLLTLPACYLLKSPAERLDYLISKHPELATTDTMTLTDTLITELLQLDSVYVMSPGGRDTLIIREHNITTRIIRQYDTLYVRTTAAPDTIIRTQTVTVERIKHVPMSVSDAASRLWQKYRWWVLGLVVLILALLILRRR